MYVTFRMWSRGSSQVVKVPVIKNPPANAEEVRDVGGEDPLEEDMATHSSILAWRIARTEEPGRIQSIELHTVRHDWSHLAWEGAHSGYHVYLEKLRSLKGCVGEHWGRFLTRECPKGVRGEEPRQGGRAGGRVTVTETPAGRGALGSLPRSREAGAAGVHSEAEAEARAVQLLSSVDSS